MNLSRIEKLSLVESYLRVAAYLHVHKALQDRGKYLQMRVNKLRLHVQTVQREAVPQLDISDHGLLRDHLVLQIFDSVRLRTAGNLMGKEKANFPRAGQPRTRHVSN